MLASTLSGGSWSATLPVVDYLGDFTARGLSGGSLGGLIATYAAFGHRRPLNAVLLIGTLLIANMALTTRGQLPYLLDRLKASQDGDSNLLEKTMIVYGSPMADGNLHNHRRCPLALFGKANGVLTEAEKVQAAQGWGAWPSCTSKLGLR